MNPKELRLIDETLRIWDVDLTVDVFQDEELNSIEDSEFQRLRKEYLYNKQLLLDYLAIE